MKATVFITNLDQGSTQPYCSDYLKKNPKSPRTMSSGHQSKNVRVIKNVLGGYHPKLRGELEMVEGT